MAEQSRPTRTARWTGTALTKLLRNSLAAAAALLLWQGEALATHAMGGELTYECIGANQYRVRLNFYRDCNGVDAPSNCSNGRQFRVRSTQCNATLTPCFGLDGVDVVTPICLSAVDRCTSSQGQYGIQRYRYSAVINLNQWAGCGADWIIDWDLCCRNNAITSLNNPGDRNLYLYARLNNTLTPCNNSPRYLNDPTPFACVGQTVSYNHGFNDVDGDSLSFQLTGALGTNGTAIPYNTGYSALQPIRTSGGANAVQIDPVTGTISFVPSQQQFSVVTVLVTEWRNGVVIGTYLRDVQFAIIACSNNNPTVTGINGTGQFTATVCAGVQLCFTVPSADADASQTVTMTYNNGIPGATFNISSGSRPVGTFCWTPTAANIGPNLFSVTVQDNACALNGVNNYGFTIQVTPPFTPANAGPDQSVCGFSTTLQGVQPFQQAGGTWTVVSGTGTFANPNSPTTTVSGMGTGANVYRWTVNYGTCGTTSDEVTINVYDPNHPVANAGPNQSLCLPTTSTTLAANNAIAPAAGQWTVVSGSGTFANTASPTTTVSGLATGANVFRWTIDNGACTPPTASQVTVLVFNNAQAAANAGPDQQLCAPTNSTALAGNPAVFPATGQWTVVSGTGTFANTASPTTTVSGLSIGLNTLRWTINNGPCTPPTTEDEVNITVFNPASPAANAGPNQQVCAAGTTLAGNTPTPPATGQWTVVSGTGTFANTASPTTAVSGLSIGTNVFQWSLNNGPCAGGATNSQVTVTRFDPDAPAANAGPDQDLCTINGGGTANSTLAGNTPASPSTGTWTSVSGTGTITNPNSPTSTVTGMPPGTHVFRWTINNGPCTPPTTSDEVVIRVFDRDAADASAGPDQEFCAPVTTVALAGNAAVPPAVGTWTVVSGTGTFANPNDPATTVTGMGIGNNVYRWSLGNGACPGPGTEDDVVVRLYDPATPDADAGPDQQICGTASATLAGNTVAFPAQGTWTLVSGTGTIANANNPTTSVTGIGIGTSVFRWTVDNGPCGTTSDEVSISRFSNSNPPANAGPDQSICVPLAPNSVILAGNTPVFPATGTWTPVSGGGTITDANNPTTTITGLPIGINEFRWTTNNGACANPVTSDIVRILVFDGSMPPADAGPDQELCGTSATTVMAGSPIVAPATGQWTLVSGTGSIADPANPNTTVSGLGVGQNIFQWTVDNGPCAVGTTTDQMSIFVYDPDNPSANAGPNQNLCTTAGNTITLNGSPVIFPATGTWTVSGGPATIVSPNSPTTLVTGLGVGSYSFTWTVDNGVCPNPISSSTTIIIVADGDAQPADAGPDQSLCGTASTTSLNANAPTGVATGSWTVVQGTAVFDDATSPTTGVSGLSIGVNTLRWNIDNGDCGITTDEVTILVYDPNQPDANAGPDQFLCTPVTSTNLAGSPLIIPAVGQWTLVSGTGTIANAGSPVTTVSGLGLGENIFRWTVNNGACTNPITTDLVSIFVFASNAAVADAGPDQELCTPVTSTNFAGNSPTAPAVGTWTLVNGGGTIVSPNDPNSLVTDLPVGANTFAWTIDNGACGTTTDEVTILVFDENNPDADAGPDQELCTPVNSTTLAGSPVTFPATGQWTLVSGSGNIANPADPNTTVTGLSIGENIFEWTVNNGPCANGTTSDRVSVFVFYDQNPNANAGPDQQLCTPPTTGTTLTGSPVIFPARGTWTLVNGQGTITSPNSPTTTVTGLGIGVNRFRWEVYNGPCANGTTADTVGIFLFDGNNADADAGPDQELCTPDTGTDLQGSLVASPAVGTWTLVSGTGTIANPNDPGTLVTNLSVGENVFQWTVDNGPCGSPTSDRVSIFVFDENNPDANAGPDQELCTPVTITILTGSPVTFPATGTWTLVSGQGNITSPNSPTTTVTGLGVGENVFRWEVYNGPCENGITSDDVTILLYDLHNPTVNAGPDQQLCTPTSSTTLQGSSVIFPAVGTWTLVSGTGSIADPNDPNTLVTNLTVGENIFRWTIDNGPCENNGAFDEVSIFLFDENNVDADAGPDQDLCTANITTTTLNGSPVIFPAVGTWTLVSGTGTIANPNDPNTTVFDLTIGTSVFRWTVDNGPCANGTTSDEMTIRIFDANNPDADAGPDQDLCTPTMSTMLNGSPATSPAIGTWTVLSGTGTVTDPNNPNTSITGLGVGTIVVEWRVDNGPCANGITADTMVIQLFDQNNPLADAGPDQELCTPDDQTNLQGSPVTAPAAGTWTLVSGTGAIADPNDPNTLVTGLTVGENVFLWTVSNGPCANSLTSDLVSIFVFDENNPDADAGPDQQVCTPVTNAIMAGSPVTFPARGTWTLVSGTGTIVDPSNPNTNITGLGIGVNVFRWEVYNGTCANGLTSDEVAIVLFDANAPPADAGADQELCAPDDSAILTGNTPVGAATGTWTQVQGTGAITDPDNPVTSVTGLTVGENIFTWTIVSGTCVTTSDSMSVFVFDPNNPDANAGLDQELCMPQDSVFMAGSPLIFPARGTWTLVSGAGTPVDPSDPNTLVQRLSIGRNVFRWEVYNGPCANGLTADTVVITLYDDTTAAANAGPDIEICLPITSVQLQGVRPPPPAQGTWTLIAGTGTPVDPNDPTTVVNGLSQGINTFVWTLEWDPCPNNGILSDTVHVRVHDPSAPLADAGPDQELCTPTDQTNLQGNTPATPGVGTWTVVQGGGIVADVNDPNTLVTGLTVGEHILVWTIYNGQCGFGPSSFDTVRVFVHDANMPQADAGPDQEFCTPVSIAILAGSPVIFPGTGVWTRIAGGGTLVNPSDPNTTVTTLTVGSNTFVWSVDNGACGSSTDTVTVFIYDGNSAVADAGPDEELCTPNTSTTLTGNAPVFPATGLWTLVNGTGTIADLTNPVTGVSGLSVGTNTFQWTIDNEPCGTTSDQVTITVFDENHPVADAGPDQSICTPTNSVTLSGSPVTFPATGTWTIVSGNGTLANPNDPNTTLSGLGTGVVTLRWTVANGPCGSSDDEVTITIFNGSATPADAGNDQHHLCTPDNATTLVGNDPVFPATGTWTLVSGPGTIVNPTSSSTPVTGLGVGPNVFRWTIDNGTCGSSDDEVTIFVYDHTEPPANAGPDQVHCIHLTTETRLDAVPTTSTGRGSWTLFSGTGTIDDASDPNTLVTGLGAGGNQFIWTVNNGACGTTRDTVLVFMKDCLTIRVPNSFSPNGDGTNDRFIIPNIESYPKSSLVVFNRWGNKVYESSPYVNQWDGTSQFGAVFGEKLPESTYYCILDLGDGSEPYTGFIYLRR